MSRMTDQIGRVLSGRYRLIAPVGTGASAQVFLADDVRLRRRVAVKLLHAALADDETFLRRFRAEAQAAAGLSHPNIVAVFDWGGDDGTPYIVTEYLSGGSLRGVLDNSGRLSPSQALLIGLEATRALDYAHRRGIVHRDIKPANLLFGEDGRLRIADFGLARALAEAAWTEPQGAVLGTARYASPEQAQGELVDGRADVYSLGLVLIEAVTGTVPFTADTTIATLMARVGKVVPVPEEMGPLRKPLLRVGQPLPADRSDAGELSISLMACAEDMPRPEPIPLPSGSGVVDLGIPAGDATMLGASAHAPSRLAEPDDITQAAAAIATDEAATAAVTDGAEIGDGPDDDLAALAPYEPPGRKRRWPIVLLSVVLAALLGVGAAWAVVENRTPAYAIPRLVDISEQQALAAIDGYGWEVERRTDRKDGSQPGQVLKVDPAVGEQLKRGGRLIMWVSEGNTLAAIPGDLVGQTIEDATAALQAAGGFVATVASEEFSEDHAKGIVLALGPEAADEMPKGSDVPLIVSMGPAPRTIPSGLAGKSFDQAKAALAEAQLEAKKVEQFSDTVDPGQVIGLQPAEGGQVPRGSTVEVLVSKGPDLVEVPSVKGKDLDGAIAVLEGAGLTVGDVFGPARGKPFDTSPSAGKKVKRGTTVDIYLRR